MSNWTLSAAMCLNGHELVMNLSPCCSLEPGGRNSPKLVLSIILEIKGYVLLGAACVTQQGPIFPQYSVQALKYSVLKQRKNRHEVTEYWEIEGHNLNVPPQDKG